MTVKSARKSVLVFAVVLLCGTPTIKLDVKMEKGVGLGKVCLIVSEAQAAKVWDGQAGNGLWFSGSNWNPDGVPATADDAIDPLSTTITYDSVGQTSTTVATFTAPESTFSDTLLVKQNSVLMVTDEVTYDDDSTGSYTITVESGGTGTQDGGIVNVGSTSNPDASTAGFDWLVNNTTGQGDVAKVVVYGLVGDGVWTVKGNVEVNGIIRTLDPWFVKDGGSVTVDQILEAIGWRIAETGIGMVTVDEAMRIQSTTVYPSGSIDADDDTNDNGLPRLVVHGPLDILGELNASDGLVNADRLNVISGGNINLKDGDGDTQLYVTEAYARFNANALLQYGDSDDPTWPEGAKSNHAYFPANAGALDPEPLSFLGQASRIQRVQDTEGSLWL